MEHSFEPIREISVATHFGKQVFPVSEGDNVGTWVLE
jgi:hypothetical protein